MIYNQLEPAHQSLTVMSITTLQRRFHRYLILICNLTLQPKGLRLKLLGKFYCSTYEYQADELTHLMTISACAINSIEAHTSTNKNDEVVSVLLFNSYCRPTALLVSVLFVVKFLLPSNFSPGPSEYLPSPKTAAVIKSYGAPPYASRAWMLLRSRLMATCAEFPNTLPTLENASTPRGY